MYVIRNYAIKYDGTNSAEIVAALPSCLNMFSAQKRATVVSETGGVLALSYHSNDLGDVVVAEGDWVCWQDSNSGASSMPDADFNRAYVLLPD